MIENKNKQKKNNKGDQGKIILKSQNSIPIGFILV